MARAGRKPTGGAAVVDTTMKKKVQAYLDEHIDDMLADIEALKEPKDRLNARMKLFDYVVPKVQATRTVETEKKTTKSWLLDKESGL